MPGKSKLEKVKTVKAHHSADDLWVAPRQPSHKPPRIYEPVSGSPLNRYLEFADIALGVKTPGARKQKAAKSGGSSAAEKLGSKFGSSKFGSKTVSIGHGRRGFGAFRNSR